MLLNDTKYDSMTQKAALFGFATCTLAPLQLFALVWSRPDAIRFVLILTQMWF
jgi:hypothetical protein